jgi:hypothetical protein
MTRLLAGLIVFALASLSDGSAFAEEVRIGHLETKDDTGINWLYFRCEKPNATQMRCDLFNTLIYRKKSDAEIDADLKQQAAADLLTEFNKNLGKSCKPFVENEAKIKAGIGVDGRPINPRNAASSPSIVKGMIEVCKTPTQETASRFFKSLAEQERHTSNVHNDHSLLTFIWNPQTNSWISAKVRPVRAALLCWAH